MDDATEKTPRSALLPGNRQVLTDLYASENIQHEPREYAFKIYIRLNAKKQTVFQHVSFQHSIFDTCYFNRCVFNSCEFTGCRFIELDATATYLRKSWLSSETYYREKYPGWKKLRQFIKWMEFKTLDVIWGNGENTLKLLRTIIVIHILIAVYDTAQFGDAWNLRHYLASVAASPAVFFGIATPRHYPIWVISAIAAIRLIGFAFLTAILVKRFGRR